MGGVLSETSRECRCHEEESPTGSDREGQDSMGETVVDSNTVAFVFLMSQGLEAKTTEIPS